MPPKLSSFKDHDIPTPIDIRVLTKWILIARKQELCYLFVDSYGDGIETSSDLNDRAYFESIIQVHSCYRIDNYVVTKPKMFRPILNHNASLIIGKKALIEPISGTSIPHHFFSFATYDELDERIGKEKQLTDYIAFVKTNTQKTTKSGKILRKVDLIDISNNPVQITLWPEKFHLIGDNILPGDIIAMTSAMVTEFEGLKQLESTYSTEVFINPDFPETQQHVASLKALYATTQETQKIITLSELLYQPGSNNTIACAAQIKEIYAYRKWYYVQCSNCPKKLLMQFGESIHYVCPDHDHITPMFMYCVNALLADDTTTKKVVFFNETMTSMLGTTCHDMVTTHGYTNPTTLPPVMVSKIGVPMIFQLILRSDHSITVSNVSNTTPRATAKQDSLTAIPTPVIPTTPNPKPATSKRNRQPSPDTPDKRNRM